MKRDIQRGFGWTFGGLIAYALWTLIKLVLFIAIFVVIVLYT